jgi:Putative zinc-finger
VKCSLLTLSCYVDSELPAPRKGELEAHLVGCHRCRAGLGHLREEVERVEGLARVHVPESSVRLLLEHTGLIAAGDPMPAIPDAATVAEPSPTTPPWLRGGTGAALPWATGRPSSPRRALQVPPPGGPVAPPPPEPSTAPDTYDVWAAARMEPPPAEATEAAPEQAGEPEAAAVAEAVVEAESAVEPETPAEPEASTVAEGAAVDATAELEVTASPEPPRQGRLARRRARALARREAAAVADAVEHPGPEPAVVLAAAAGAATAVAEPDAPAMALSTAGSTSSTSDPGMSGTAEIAPAAVPPGGDAVPVWTPESSAETPPVPRYPLTDEDALEEPTTVERFGPMPAPRPGLVDRFREKLALRRALRVAALDDRDDGIEIVSGPGAPMRGTRSRADLARRRSEALRPANRPDAASDDAAAATAPPGPADRTLRREPTVDELLPPPARPSSLTGAAAPPPAPLVEEQDDWTPWRPAEPAAEAPRRRRATPAPAGAAAGAEAPAATRTVDGRRLAVVLGAAIVLMFVVGVASARSTSPLPITSSSDHSAAPPAVGTTPERPAVVPPAPPPAVVAPAPKPATALPALTGTVTVGDGAPGWSVQDIRYGAHTGYLRMVLDLVPAAGAASGSPHVTIGFQDPTTLIISLDQVVAHGAPGQPLAGGLVTSVSLLTPPPAAGSTAYVVRLAHPVTFTPSFATGPLRLILDLH